MRYLPLIPLLGFCTFVASTDVIAGYDRHARHQKETYIDHARVVRVEPIIRYVRIPVQHRACREDRTHRHRYRDNSDSYVPLILGGVIGGVVGNQLGDGRGRDVMTVAGTVIGATVAHNLTQRPSGRHWSRKRDCRKRLTYREEERIDGYRVTYRYRGRIFVTPMDHDPGRRVKLKVRVEPTDDDGQEGGIEEEPFRL